MDRVFRRRVYPLTSTALSEEELAAVFAMTSRSSDPLDEVAQTITPQRASEFHERWVLGYGHASVAEHAVVRLAVENISRLACDDLEDNRLGSYTEKSSRYYVFSPGYYYVYFPEERELSPRQLRLFSITQPRPRFYYVPEELDKGRGRNLRKTYVQTCDKLFATYRHIMDQVMTYLRRTVSPRDDEPASAYQFRIRHQAADSCRFLLPAATLTSVGVTMNARVLGHAISKLLSSDLAEQRALGQELKSQGGSLTPTLLKGSQRSEYLERTREAQREGSRLLHPGGDQGPQVALVQFDPEAERRLAAAILYRYASASYQEAWDRVKALSRSELERVLDEGLKRIDPQESPVRELEYVAYTFDFVMDYGAYREFKRHRMQVYVAQPLTIDHGYETPPLIVEAGQEKAFREAVQAAEDAYRRVAKEYSPVVAQYLVTHAHKRRVLSRMDLRQLYHFFRMRNSPYAHFTIRRVAAEAMRLVNEKHPLLLRHLKLESD
jgi:thymidylate synthase ThyX